jgi:hypothetical protein
MSVRIRREFQDKSLAGHFVAEPIDSEGSTPIRTAACHLACQVCFSLAVPRSPCRLIAGVMISCPSASNSPQKLGIPHHPAHSEPNCVAATCSYSTPVDRISRSQADRFVSEKNSRDKECVVKWQILDDQVYDQIRYPLLLPSRDSSANI